MIFSGQSECSVPWWSQLSSARSTTSLHLTPGAEMRLRPFLEVWVHRGFLQQPSLQQRSIFLAIWLLLPTEPPESSGQWSWDVLCIARAGSEHHVKFTSNLSIILYQPLLAFIRLLFMFHVPQFLGSPAHLAIASLMLSLSHVGGRFGPQVCVCVKHFTWASGTVGFKPSGCLYTSCFWTHLGFSGIASHFHIRSFLKIGYLSALFVLLSSYSVKLNYNVVATMEQFTH